MRVCGLNQFFLNIYLIPAYRTAFIENWGYLTQKRMRGNVLFIKCILRKIPSRNYSPKKMSWKITIIISKTTLSWEFVCPKQPRNPVSPRDKLQPYKVCMGDLNLCIA